MIAVEYKSTEDILKQKMQEADALIPKDDESKYSPLYTHIMKAFQENKDIRESSGANNILIESLRQYNGEYSAEDLAKIRQEGGSAIFMNLTSTKVRAAIAWIKDILLASKEDSFLVEPTPDPELPPEVEMAIEQKIAEEFQAMEQQGQQGSEGMARTLKDINERKRDLYDAIQEERNKEAKFAFKIYERKIKDQLKEGKWDTALSEFIDDFCIFPTAILKGPIVTKTTKLKWLDGMPVPATNISFVNKRISPFDVYPAPEADDPQKGNFIEHMRLSRKEVASLIGVPTYDDEALQRVLENDIGKGLSALDTNIEQDKAEQELKDNDFDASKNVFHALHFFGTAPVKLLREWGLTEDISELEEFMEVEIEAITIGNECVRCIINDDPLNRRPYYIASFQKRPGSFWGTSIPWQMRDIQRMCNATSRALSNNMGLSSGPIMEVNIDRLADGQEVEELLPRDIVQTKSDPAGSSQRAIQFFSVPSNAAELLGVYKDFELRADDVTMIPRYSYGNERSGGAAQTASGLSMLLESASKGIKDAIRHIDEGVIIPRVEMEFYFMMVANPNLQFTGDINVIARGSQALTMRGAEQMRRNEFLQITANPIDQKILGVHGRATLLRSLSKDLGFTEDIVPGRQELKAAAAAEAQAAAQQAQSSDAMAMVEKQTQAQLAVTQMNKEAKDADRAAKIEKDAADIQLRVKAMEDAKEEARLKAMKDLEQTGMQVAAKAEDTNKKIALELRNAG